MNTYIRVFDTLSQVTSSISSLENNQVFTISKGGIVASKTSGTSWQTLGGTPVGSIALWAGNTIPEGWLECNGQAVSRTTYSALYSALTTYYGSGNGSTTFNVPDLRNTTPVGIGTRGSGISVHDTYSRGTFKDDQIQNITGTISSIMTGDGTGYGTGAMVATGTGSSPREGGSNNRRHQWTFNMSSYLSDGGVTAGTNTHPRRTGLRYIIKAY